MAGARRLPQPLFQDSQQLRPHLLGNRRVAVLTSRARHTDMTTTATIAAMPPDAAI
jgi:hypothetical protein